MKDQCACSIELESGKVEFLEQMVASYDLPDIGKERAIRIQVCDSDGDLSEAESCLLKALDLDPHSIEALQEAAHFYDAVTPDAAKAMEYASRCREQAVKVAAEMDAILLQDSH